MGGDLPFLLAHGGAVGGALLAAVALAAAAWGPAIAARLDRSARDRRLRSLGPEALSGKLLAPRGPVQRHGSEVQVAASVASRGSRRDLRRARRVAVETESGLVLVRGPLSIPFGSSNERTRDATVATAVLQKYVPRVLWPSSIRSLSAGDAVKVRGRVKRAGKVTVLRDAELVYAGPIEPVATPGARLRLALFASLGLVVFATALGYGGVWLGAKSPTFHLRWTGVLAASMTPLRARALAAAEEILALELVAAMPEVVQASQYYRTRAGVGGDQAARYVALARLRGDCEHATDRLASFAVLHADLSEASAKLSLECQRPLDVVKVAEARFWESDFSSASALFDQARVVWGETDKEEIHAQNLIIYRTKREVFAHWLAGRFDSAGRTLDRLKNGARRPALECVRRSFAVVANEPDALARLREREKECPVHLASIDPSKRRALLAANEQIAHREYLYQSWAMELEPLLEPGVTFRRAHEGSSVARLETPHELLSFPHGTRDLDPAIVFHLLAPLERDSTPSPARRLLRARLAAIGAAFESLLGEHAGARRLTRSAKTDLAALVALPIADHDSGPSRYAHGRLEIELRYAWLLEIGVELQAGDVAAAARLAASVPELVANEKENSLDEGDLRGLAASTELVRSFVEVWQGKPERLTRFAGSELCQALSGCFIVIGDREELAKAARGDAGQCEENACLVAARHPAARTALVAQVDEMAGLAAVTDNPLDRLYRLGQARRLAQAIGDAERIARLDRWLGAVRPLALDPRLSVARKTLEHVN